MSEYKNLEMFFVYIIQSQLDLSYYIGSASNTTIRVKSHNKGYSKYTKTKRPWKLVYKEVYDTISEARKREFYLKSLKSRIAIAKLIEHGPIV